MPNTEPESDHTTLLRQAVQAILDIEHPTLADLALATKCSTAVDTLMGGTTPRDLASTLLQAQAVVKRGGR